MPWRRHHRMPPRATSVGAAEATSLDATGATPVDRRGGGTRCEAHNRGDSREGGKQPKQALHYKQAFHFFCVPSG